MSDLKAHAIRGGFVKVLAQACSLTVRVGCLMILARLLEPGDFGLVAMVAAVVGLLNIFRDFGLSTATVQHGAIRASHVSTLFWINLCVGAILTLSALVATPILVYLYHEPRVFWVAVVMSASFVCNAAGVQHFALLQRQMRFTAIAVIEVASLLASSAVGVVMALSGYGYWALVGMAIVQPAATTFGSWLATGWIPGPPRMDPDTWSMMRFGGTVTLIGLVCYVGFNLEKVLLGRFWGAQAIGIYGRAFQLVNIPTENLTATVGGVVFPVLSRLQGEPSRLRAYFLKSYAMLLSLTLPITLGSYLFADDIIFVALGPKWNEAARVFRLLAPTILVFALINPLGSLLYSLGMAGRGLKTALVLTPLAISGYLLGLPYGPEGVAFGYSAVMALWATPHIIWCLRGTGVSLIDILQVLWGPLLSGLAGSAVSLVLCSWFAEQWTPLPRLLLGAGVFSGTYICVLLYIPGHKRLVADFLGVLLKPPVASRRMSQDVSLALDYKQVAK